MSPASTVAGMTIHTTTSTADASNSLDSAAVDAASDTTSHASPDTASTTASESTTPGTAAPSDTTLHRTRAMLPTYDETELPTYIPSTLVASKSTNHIAGIFFSHPQAHYSTFSIRLDTARVDHALRHPNIVDFKIPAPVWEDCAPAVVFSDTKDRAVYFHMHPFLDQGTGSYGYSVNHGELVFSINSAPGVACRFTLPSTGGSYHWRSSIDASNAGSELGYKTSMTLYLESEKAAVVPKHGPPSATTVKKKNGFMSKLLASAASATSAPKPHDFSVLIAVATYDMTLTRDAKDVNGVFEPVGESLDPHLFPWRCQEDCAVFTGSAVAAVFGLKYCSKLYAYKYL
ncbi:hypothetical protein HDU77_009883 [Chytriomyces hyalinus]|nr:hypothetical protein HDU77_009883 [Chytriomyces hyalinus]